MNMSAKRPAKHEIFTNPHEFLYLALDSHDFNNVQLFVEHSDSVIILRKPYHFVNFQAWSDLIALNLEVFQQMQVPSIHVELLILSGYQ